MTDNGTLRDHLADVINERNELLRKVETMQAQIDELTRQLAALWKVDND
jgi:cell division septum initiation protein DivIVA